MGHCSVNHLDVLLSIKARSSCFSAAMTTRQTGFIQVFLISTVVVESFGIGKGELVFYSVRVGYDKLNSLAAPTVCLTDRNDCILLFDLREVGYPGIQQPFASSFGCEALRLRTLCFLL